jgi:exopolysaccharide biosynthesis polyprenyl glycosylphosphotransferase
MNPLVLAAVEGGILFSAVAGVLWGWGHLSADLPEMLAQIFVLSASCTVAFYYHDLYNLRVVRNFDAFVIRLLQAMGVAFILLALLYMAFPDTKMSDGPFISSIVMIFGLLLPLRAVSYAIMRSRPFTDRLLVVGVSPLALKLLHEIVGQPNCGYTVVGIIGEGRVPEPLRATCPLLGPVRDISRIIRETRPDRIVVALSERRGQLPVRELLEAQAAGVVVEDGVEVYERLAGKIAIEAITPSALLFATDFRKSRLELFVGRAMSLAVSIVGLVLLAPLMGVIAVAIKLDSSGPLFFVHERIGRCGTSFRLIKFRTMLTPDGPTSEWVRDNAQRITRVGRWLRTFRLDEVPQFINILRGDMNLIGPRPHPVTNYPLFLERIPYYALRCRVRPGLIGWAQIKYGYANDLQEEIEKMRYDLFYIKHLSAWFDLKIIFDSVKIVMFGRGAQTADLAADAIAPAPLPETAQR